MTEPMTLRCAILDDYQNVALSMADWSKVANDIEIQVFNEHLGAADEVVAALHGFASSAPCASAPPFRAR